MRSRIDYPEDIEKLRQIPSLRALPAWAIQEIYADYSDRYAAGWLALDAYFESFKHWLDSHPEVLQ